MKKKDLKKRVKELEERLDELEQNQPMIVYPPVVVEEHHHHHHYPRPWYPRPCYGPIWYTTGERFESIGGTVTVSNTDQPVTSGYAQVNANFSQAKGLEFQVQ